MKRSTIAAGALAAAALLLAAAAAYRALDRSGRPVTAAPPAKAPPAPPAAPDETPAAPTHQGFLYGRLATVEGGAYEGRLRWGGDQESFWGDYFNGFKADNPWIPHVPPDRLPRERRGFEIFGFEFGGRERPKDLGRPFMARFGDVARIEAVGARGVRVTLKSGSAFDLDRFEAGDFDDGVRVWDARRGAVDLDTLRIRTIEFLPTPRLDGAVPTRLHGTVRTRQGEFTGFLQWDREECAGSDTLEGRTSEGEVALRFDTLRAIARESDDSSRVTRLDGREIVLSGTPDVGDGNRGIYVDDPRYGRVLVSWDAFERVDFGPGDGGPAYGDFPPGSPLTGALATRDGRRFAGRLVYDLDESETTETLDAPFEGVDYTLPFGQVAAIALPAAPEAGTGPVKVTLRTGEELQLEPTGDLGPGNAGVLIFAGGQESPDYIPWTEVERIDFDGPPVARLTDGG